MSQAPASQPPLPETSDDKRRKASSALSPRADPTKVQRTIGYITGSAEGNAPPSDYPAPPPTPPISSAPPRLSNITSREGEGGTAEEYSTDQRPTPSASEYGDHQPRALPNFTRVKPTFTRAGNDGFPDVHITPAHVFQHWSEEDYQLFEKRTDKSLCTALINLAGDHFATSLQLSYDTVNAVLQDIGVNARPLVGGLSDFKKRNSDKTMSPVRWFYVTGLTWEDFTKLRSRRCWNGTRGTIFVHEYPLPITDFATTISGLVARAADLADVQENFNEALTTSADVLRFIEEEKADLLMAGSDGMSEDLRDDLAKRTRVTAQDPPPGSEESTLWCVYTPNITSNPEHWEEWLDIVQKTPIATDLTTGNERGAKTIWCQVCQSLDHTSDFCKYPKIPGWVPQVNLTIEKAPKGRGGAPRGRGSGRGGRGRGRGRGTTPVGM